MYLKEEMVKERHPHPSWIEIDLGQFRQNIRLIKQYLGDVKLCLPVKANAYGHGLSIIGKVAEEEHVDYLAVAHLEEGAILRKAGVLLPILVLGAIHEDQIPLLIHYDLEISISSEFKADSVAKVCKELNTSCRVHLEVDTGMRRTGVRKATAYHLYHHIKQMDSLHIVGVYSHIASAEHGADGIAQTQINVFKELKIELQDDKVMYHLSSSNSCMHFSHANFDMVRPAISIFGYPSKLAPYPFNLLRPCLSLKSKVAYFKVVEAGEGISYGHTYVTSKRTRIVTIPIGYGDGYRRCLSNKAHVLIRGKRFPVVGSICMDQFMVDVGDHEVFVGDEVVLIGKQGSLEIPLEEIATLCESISYEVLCLFSDRLPRQYKDQREIAKATAYS